MNSVTEIFEAWPNTAEFGRDIGLPYPTVAAWKQRGSIPVVYWRTIIQAARRRGFHEITGDLLIDLHSDEAGQRIPNGFAEDAPPLRDQAPRAGARQGHFSRFKHPRRVHFRTAAEIEEHISALRDEWSHR